MPREVAEDVDLVCRDKPRCLLGQKPEDIPPVNTRLLRHRARHCVLAVVRIAEDLEPLAVEGTKERQQEEGDCVMTEIGRDIADAKPRVRVLHPRVRHALHMGKEAVEALGQPRKRRTLLHGDIVERK